MIRYLLLDLDNTLYPGSCGLGAFMSRRMRQYVVDHLEVSPERATELRKGGLGRHGTTLRWLVEEHELTNIEEFLEYVHPTDPGDFLSEDDRTSARRALEEVDLPASILTNSPREHADRVLSWLGLQDRFENIFDIRFNQMTGKPHPDSYRRALETAGSPANETLFADDVLQYVLPFRDMGGHAYLVSPGPATETGIGTMESITELAGIVSQLRRS